ncbi:hypothetical protein QR721_06540 [Aciduricibacillus chroicocephali]|uniref:Phage protein n=1 Tax=Aciduricibacillus chroicocephali TaxID=3054939 RepID=A0ABY9KYV0_9BACI|nr:hypothetical protein QR721_06540 [Bacillaceae bacterium 44XB]
MITIKERELAQRYLCLDIALQVDSTPDMLLEYQSVTERMRKLKLLIEHESTVGIAYGFLIKSEDHEKKEIYTKSHLAYLVKRTLKEFNGE